MSKNKIYFIICSAVVIVLGVVLVCVLPKYVKDTNNGTESDLYEESHSDNINDNEPVTRDYSYIILTESEQADIVLPESEQFAWYKKPFLETTYMQAVKDELYYNSIYKYIDTEYVAYYIDDKCGLVNNYGEIISDPIYISPIYCPEANGITFNSHWVKFDFETKTFADHGGHGGGYSDFIYDRNSGNYFLIGGSEGPDEPYDYDESGVYIVYETYVEAVEYACDFYIEENGEYTNYSCNITGKLGLYNNGKIVIPFEYVAATEVSDGVVGMFDGNTWTYFSVDGKAIMKNVPKNNDTFSYFDGTSEIIEMSVFNYSCGCVPVKKDGKWGYMDKNGKMIVDAVFDYALPAFENRAWVCVDYYWGIIEI